MKAPKLWRKRRGRGGKFVGSYHVTLKGEDVNLGTSDAGEALKRLVEAKRGKRNFADELEEAAAAVDGTPEVQPPAPPPSSPPLVPDAVIPPPAPPLQLPPAPSAEDARAEAEATNAAAGDVGGDAANDNGAPPPQFDPAAIDAMLEMAAHGVVDLQLQLQAWVIKKRFKRIAGEIPPEAQFREMAAKAWAMQLKLWIPTFNPPPWVIAVVLPLALSTQQLVTSTPIPKENQVDPQTQAAA